MEGVVPTGEELSLRESALENWQEGILSPMPPTGHWFPSSHSICTMTFAKSGFSLMSLS